MGLFLGPEFKFIKNFNLWRHFDFIMTKRPNTHISETDKVYCVIMTSLFNQTLEIFHKDLSNDWICPHQIWFSSDIGERS